MNAWSFALGAMIVVASVVVALAVVTAVTRVQIARHTGTDPRLDDDLRREAIRKVGGS